MWRLCLSTVAILFLLPPSAMGERPNGASDGTSHCSRSAAILDDAREAGQARVAAILNAHAEVPVPAAVRAVFARVAAVARGLPGGSASLMGYRSGTLMGTAVWTGAVLVSSAAWTGDSALPEDELAALFAHELAHLERGDVPRALCETLGLAGSEAGRAREARARLMQRIAGGELQLALRLQLANHARELAADAHAMNLLAAAGYEGRAMLRLLHKLSREGSGAASFTHPATERRIEEAQSALLRFR